MTTYLEDLKVELIKAQRLAIDEDGEVLVWQPTSTPVQSESLPDTPVSQATQPEPPVAGRQAPDAERRQITVMFCDLADSTRLSGQLDPEDLREVIRAYQAACVGVIQRFAGYVAQYLGDGLLVYFGYPQAHEDDPQRAVRTGLELLAAIRTLNTQLVQDQGVRLAVRIGIHTGLVVVGEMGSGGRHEHLALGDTPNLAARLQGLAAPDTVVLSDTTARLVQGYFVCQDRGVHTLKGIDTPVHVSQVVGESAAQSRLDVAAASGLTPLVGRETEVTLLLERWAQARDGLGQVVLLSGEAGIGKSRLVRALTERVVTEGAPRLTLHCSPYHTNSAFYPVIDHLQRLLHWHRDVSPEARLTTLEQAIQAARLPLEEAVPLLAALLSLPVPERYPPLTLSPQRQKQQTQEALVAWLLAETAQQPVLAVWEDLHWADPSTLELLGLLLDQVPTARLLLVLTARPEFQPAMGPAGAPDAAHPHPSGAPAGGGDGAAGDGRQAPAGRGGAADRGEDGRYPAVCGRAGQDGPRIGARPGGSRPVRPDRPAAAPGDSGHIAGCPDGPAGPAGRGQRGGAARRRAGAGVFLCAAAGGDAAGGAHPPAEPGAARGGGTALPAGPSPAGDVYL